MKKSFAAVLGALAFASTAFAATPTAEPPLPSDIATTWEKRALTCQEQDGKTPGHHLYVLAKDRVLKVIQVTTINSEKVAQAERSVNERTGKVERVFYVRNSSKGNWLRYAGTEGADAIAHLLNEAGLTMEQLDVKKCQEI
jgi:hypothetical protein